MLDSVDRNAFTIDRDLLGYQQVLGTEFVLYLHGLSRDRHWVDSGAGAALAARQYLQSERFPEKARVTAVAVRRPEGEGLAEFERRFPAPSFRYLAGAPIEERPLEEIGAAALITDVYGAIQYGSQIDRLLQRYAELLEPGGRLWTALPAATFIRAGESTLEIGDWLASVEGLTPIRIPGPDAHARETVLERNGDPVSVPRLVLRRALDGPPPMREYSLADAPDRS